MALTPQDVHSQTFRERIRGYSEEEVDEFMARVADSLAVLTSERDDALEKVRILEAQVGDTDEADLLKRTLIKAERTAQETIDEARSEAERLVAEAGQDARRMLDEARRQAGEERDQARMGADRIRQAIGDLRAFRDDYVERVRSAVAEQLSMLERMSDLPELPPLIDAIEDVAMDSSTPSPEDAYSERDAAARDGYPEGPGPVLADESEDLPFRQ